MLPRHLLHFGLICLLSLIFCGRNLAAAPGSKSHDGTPTLARSPAQPDFEGRRAASVKAEKPAVVITLRQALARVLMKSPELAAFSWEVRAGEARSLQAGLWPNPELALEVEDFGGSDELTSFDGAETTLSLSQLVELGGKRAKRLKKAGLAKDLDSWNYESKRLDVFSQTAQAFVAVLAAQERQLLAENSLHLAQRGLDTVSERVKAGKVPPLEETKSKVAFSTRRIELERAKRELAATRQGLAAAWGSVAPAFTRAVGDFEAVAAVPPPETLLQKIHQNPDLLRWQTEIEARQADLSLEKAGRIPDMTLNAGVRRFEETDDVAFILAFSLPLPLFNRNQGAIQAAGHQLAKSRAEQRGVRIRLESSLAQTVQVLSASYLEAHALKREVLPAAQHAFDVAREGYRQGKFGFLEVLDAQRTLFDAKAQYIDTLAAYHKLRAEMERLLGHSFNLPATANPPSKEAAYGK